MLKTLRLYSVLCLPFLFSILLLIGCSGENNPLEPESPHNEPPPLGLNPFEQNQRLGRGVSFGNILEAPYEGAWGITLKEEFFPLVKSAGFEAVRIPIRWSAQAEARGMSWSYWEFCAGFGVYDKSTQDWRAPLLSALMP